MKQLIIAAALLAIAPIASAQLYKYVDKDGKTVYSDQPPANLDTKQLNIQSGTTSTPANAQKSAVERDREAQKLRDDTAKKSEQASKVAAQKDQICEAARKNYSMYMSDARLQKINAQGETEFLTDDEIGAAREKAKRDMDEACK